MSQLSDPISDFLTRLKNASRAGKEEFSAPYSAIKVEIAKILQAEGYIWGFETDSTGRFPELRVKPKFVENSPALTDLKRVSKPGLRKYVGSEQIPRVLGGLGISILSTSKGVMTGSQARRQKLGGEVLALVW